MIEDLLIKKFSEKVRVSQSGEIYLPIVLGKEFVNECNKLDVAIIGVDLFKRKDDNYMPVDPVSGIDNSSLLHEYSDWYKIVKNCNEFVLKVIGKEEETDNSIYFNPTVLEKTEWEN